MKWLRATNDDEFLTTWIVPVETIKRIEDIDEWNCSIILDDDFAINTHRSALDVIRALAKLDAREVGLEDIGYSEESRNDIYE